MSSWNFVSMQYLIILNMLVLLVITLILGTTWYLFETNDVVKHRNPTIGASWLLGMRLTCANNIGTWWAWKCQDQYYSICHEYRLIRKRIQYGHHGRLWQALDMPGHRKFLTLNSYHYTKSHWSFKIAQWAAHKKIGLNYVEF